MKQEIVIYCDGACSANPGPGGWAYLLQHWVDDGLGATLNGSATKSGEIVGTVSNNRMELQAVIEALRAIHVKLPVTLYTDSAYVVDNVPKLDGWAANNWRRQISAGGDRGKMKWDQVKNWDLWQDIRALIKMYNPVFKWVEGHSDNVYNKQVDKLARAAAQSAKAKVALMKNL